MRSSSSFSPLRPSCILSNSTLNCSFAFLPAVDSLSARCRSTMPILKSAASAGAAQREHGQRPATQSHVKRVMMLALLAACDVVRADHSGAPNEKSTTLVLSSFLRVEGKPNSMRIGPSGDCQRMPAPTA